MRLYEQIQKTADYKAYERNVDEEPFLHRDNHLGSLNSQNRSLYHLGERPCTEHHGGTDSDVEKRRLGDLELVRSPSRSDEHEADDDVEEDDDGDEQVHKDLKDPHQKRVDIRIYQRITYSGWTCRVAGTSAWTIPRGWIGCDTAGT